MDNPVVVFRVDLTRCNKRLQTTHTAFDTTCTNVEQGLEVVRRSPAAVDVISMKAIIGLPRSSRVSHWLGNMFSDSMQTVGMTSNTSHHGGWCHGTARKIPREILHCSTSPTDSEEDLQIFFLDIQVAFKFT